MSRVRFVSVLVILLSLAALMFGGIASASTSTRHFGPQVMRVRTNAVPNLNQGESANFTLVNDGRSLVVFGTARGMQDNTSYNSLVYADNACSVPIVPTGTVGNGLTLGGAWQDHGNGVQGLYEAYRNGSYRTVTGKVHSVSVRAITNAVNAGGGNYTLTDQARACAPVPNGI